MHEGAIAGIRSLTKLPWAASQFADAMQAVKAKQDNVRLQASFWALRALFASGKWIVHGRSGVSLMASRQMIMDQNTSLSAPCKCHLQLVKASAALASITITQIDAFLSCFLTPSVVGCCLVPSSAAKAHEPFHGLRGHGSCNLRVASCFVDDTVNHDLGRLQRKSGSTKPPYCCS